MGGKLSQAIPWCMVFLAKSDAIERKEERQRRHAIALRKKQMKAYKARIKIDPDEVL